MEWARTGEQKWLATGLSTHKTVSLLLPRRHIIKGSETVAEITHLQVHLKIPESINRTRLQDSEF